MPKHPEPYYETVVRKLREQDEADTARLAERNAAAVEVAEAAVELAHASLYAWSFLDWGTCETRYRKALDAYKAVRQ